MAKKKREFPTDLATVVTQIQQEFGDGAIMRLGAAAAGVAD